MSTSKMVSIVLVVLIHVLLGYALVTGLAYNAIKKVAEDLDVIDIQEDEPEPEPEEPPPPPPDQPIEPPPVVSPPPIVAPVVAPRPTVTTAPTAPPRPRPQIVAPPAAAPPPPPPPPPPPSQARGASNKGTSWFARVQSNYPSRAMREEREGRVGVRVTVTPDGRATNCQVTSSSGHSDLNQAACSGVERYGRFNAALDDAGNPTTGTWTTTVVFKLD